MRRKGGRRRIRWIEGMRGRGPGGMVWCAWLGRYHRVLCVKSLLRGYIDAVCGVRKGLHGEISLAVVA